MKNLSLTSTLSVPGRSSTNPSLSLLGQSLISGDPFILSLHEGHFQLQQLLTSKKNSTSLVLEGEGMDLLACSGLEFFQNTHLSSGSYFGVRKSFLLANQAKDGILCVYQRGLELLFASSLEIRDEFGKKNFLPKGDTENSPDSPSDLLPSMKPKEVPSQDVSKDFPTHLQEFSLKFWEWAQGKIRAVIPWFENSWIPRPEMPRLMRRWIFLAIGCSGVGAFYFLSTLILKN